MKKKQIFEMKKIIKKNNGITLIALVITIIVLLILATVSIATLTGENGILTRADSAKEETKQAEEIEKIKIAVSEAQIAENGYRKLNQNGLQKAIDNEFGLGSSIVSDNGDETFTVSFFNKGNVYNIGDDINKIEVDMYIDNAKELREFRDRVNNGETFENKYIQLTNEIDLNGEEWEPIGLYVDSSSNINTKPFKGIFDGNGYKIDNFKLTTSNYQCQGLFGIIINGTVKNLEIGDNCIITGNSNKTGSIVGFLYNNSNMINCGNNADINCPNNKEVGGLIGTTNLSSNVYNCYNSGNIIAGQETIGGIVGNFMNGKIISCYNTGNLTCIRGGGITGCNLNNSYMENCYNIGILNVEFYEYAAITSRTATQENVFKNNFYLENIVNNKNDSYVIEGIEAKDETSIKKSILLLGTNYKEDVENINNGYPILNWQ